MAGVRYPMKTTIRARVQIGMDPNSGEPFMRNRNFHNIRTDISAEDAYTMLDELMSLQKHPVYGMEQIDYGELRLG